MPPSTPTSKLSSYLEPSSSLSMSWADPASSPSSSSHHQSSSSSSTSSNSLQENAEHVSKLFTTTITSLAADVHALKHLTTWKEILQHKSSDDENDDGENNGDENNNGNPVNNERREEFLESLCDLHDVVTSVEKKVGVLRQIVSEEQRALEKMNMLHKESLDQNEHLKYLVERCRNMQASTTTATDDNPLTTKQNNGKSTSTSTSSKLPSKAATSQNQGVKSHSKQHHSSFSHQGAKENNSNIGKVSNHSANYHQKHHAHAEGLNLYFDQVTPKELESVPRTTRGRVQVLVINQALDSIEKCFHKKAVKARRQQQLMEEAKKAALSHYEAPHPDDETADTEIVKNLVVTEEELRRSCTFFAAGEHTARTVLAVLKELKRIKQVPARRKGTFTYKLCLD